MKVPQVVRQFIDRISARPAADHRDARLRNVARQVDSTRRRLRIVQERQNIQRRGGDA